MTQETPGFIPEEYEGQPKEPEAESNEKKTHLAEFLKAGAILGSASVSGKVAESLPEQVLKAEIKFSKKPDIKPRVLKPEQEVQEIRNFEEGLKKEIVKRLGRKKLAVEQVVEKLKPELIRGIQAVAPVVESTRSKKAKEKILRAALYGSLAGSGVASILASPELSRKRAKEEDLAPEKGITRRKFLASMAGGLAGAGVAGGWAKIRETNNQEVDDLEKANFRAALTLISRFRVNGQNPLPHAFHKDVEWDRIGKEWVQTNRILEEKYRLKSYLEKYAAVFHMLDSLHQLENQVDDEGE